MTCETTSPPTMKLRHLVSEIRRQDSELAPGSETALWGAFVASAREATGVLVECGGDEVPHDIMIRTSFATWWLAAYRHLDARPNADLDECYEAGDLAAPTDIIVSEHRNGMGVLGCIEHTADSAEDALSAATLACEIFDSPDSRGDELEIFVDIGLGAYYGYEQFVFVLSREDYDDLTNPTSEIAARIGALISSIFHG